MPTEADRLMDALMEWRLRSCPGGWHEVHMYVRAQLRHARACIGLPGSMARHWRLYRDFLRGEVRYQP